MEYLKKQQQKKKKRKDWLNFKSCFFCLSHKVAHEYYLLPRYEKQFYRFFY